VWRNVSVKDHFECPGLDGRIILKQILNPLGGGGVEWFGLLNNRDKWLPVVDTVLNIL
jgi:hypothetical protein